MVIKSYVDANHPVIMTNRRLHSGIIIYDNNATFICYSKLWNMVEVLIFIGVCFAWYHNRED